MVSEVSFLRFWGVFWGGLFSGIFRFGDRKCRFRDIAIRAFLRKIRCGCPTLRNIASTSSAIWENIAPEVRNAPNGGVTNEPPLGGTVEN